METLISSKTQSWLSWFLRGVLVLGFLIIIARLVELQVIKGNYFRSLAEGNRIERISTPASRGKILARGKEELVGNLEGKRFYVYGATLGHVTGYLGEVSEWEVGKVDPNCPEKGPKKGGALVGRGGLEEMYNCTLSGVNGEELIEVDTLGNKLRSLGVKPAIPGEDLRTTIDIDLQKKAKEEIGDNPGALVITDIKGEVLALYSSPFFDPNLPITPLLVDKKLPLFNRAIGGMFHPGSVFKPIVGIAALSEGKIDKNFTYNDAGKIDVKTLYGDFSYSNWYFTQYGKTEGVIGLTRAIARSTDTFFYTIGEAIGVEKIAYWAGRFGLDKPTGIDIPGEIGGLVPTPEWKKKVKGENWFLGNTYHMSIGQGDMALTPLGVNMAISAIANNGALCAPHIGSPSDYFRCKQLGIKKEHLELVKEGMKEACSEGGTGYAFFDFPISVGCKTGTAETSQEGFTHAWFTLFAPADYPEIVMTVLVEKGGEGSRVAGPIAREIMDYWREARP